MKKDHSVFLLLDSVIFTLWFCTIRNKSEDNRFKSGSNIWRKVWLVMSVLLYKEKVVSAFSRLRTRSEWEMETVARMWNGPDLVDISKYLLSALVLLPVSSPSYGLNLASSYPLSTPLSSSQILLSLSQNFIRGFKLFASPTRAR